MLTKASPPIALLPAEGSSPHIEAMSLIKLYYEYNHLKQLYRQGWLRHRLAPEQCESVAEHCFAVALLGLFVCVQYYPQLDQLKVLHMALLHDFGEIYAGDITPADNITASEKYKCEWSAVQQIFGALANGQYFIDLWLEYEQGKSAESQLVRQLDRLEMALQANIYERRGWLDPQAFYHSAQQAMVWDEIKFIFEQVRGLQTTTNG